MIRENTRLSTDQQQRQQRQQTALDSLRLVPQSQHQQALCQRPLEMPNTTQSSSISSPLVILSAGQIGVNFSTGHIDARVEEQFKQAVFNLSQHLMNSKSLSSSSIEIIHVAIIVLSRAEIPKIDKIFDDCIFSLMMRMLSVKGGIIGMRKKVDRAYQVVGFPDPIVKIELRATTRITGTQELENRSGYTFGTRLVGPQL